MNRVEMKQRIEDIQEKLNSDNKADATDMVIDLLEDATNIADNLTSQEINVIAELAGNVTGCTLTSIQNIDINVKEMQMISTMAYKIAVLAYKMGLEEGE